MAQLTHRGNGIRAVAVIIDFVVWAVIGYVIAVATGSTTGSGFELEGVPAFLWFLSFFVYYIVLEGQYGQTVGKKAVGIKVVTESADAQRLGDRIANTVVVSAGAPVETATPADADAT